MASIQRKIAEGVLFGGIGNVVIKISAAIGYMLILRKLTLHDYGVFALLVSLASPASSFILFSFDRIFVSNFAVAYARKQLSLMKGLYFEFYRTAAIIAVIFFCGLFLMREFLSQFYDIYLIKYFWLTVLFIFAQLFMNMVSLFLEGCQAFKKSSFIQSAESIFRTLVVIAAYYFVPFSIGLVIFIYAIAKLFAGSIGLLYVAGLHKTLFPKGTEMQKGALFPLVRKYGKWDIGRNMLEQIMQPAKLFILKVFVSVESVAVYDFARNVYSFIVNMLPVKGVMFPVIAASRDKTEVLYLIIQKAKKYLLAVYIPVYLAVILFSPFVIEIFFPQYIGQVFAVYLLTLHIFIDIYKIELESLMYAFNKQKFIFKALPFLAITAVVLDIVFAKYWGIVGMIISWHLFALISGKVYHMYLARTLNLKKVRLRDIFHFDEYDRIILNKIKSRLGFGSN